MSIAAEPYVDIPVEDGLVLRMVRPLDASSVIGQLEAGLDACDIDPVCRVLAERVAVVMTTDDDGALVPLMAEGGREVRLHDADYPALMGRPQLSDAIPAERFTWLFGVNWDRDSDYEWFVAGSRIGLFASAYMEAIGGRHGR